MALHQQLAGLYRTMAPPRRRQLAALFALILLGAVAELATIGAVVPFLGAIGGAIPGGPLAKLLAGIMAGWPLGALAALFMAIALGAGGVRLALSWATQRFVMGFGHEIVVDIQRRVLAQPYSYHIAQNSSRVIASLEKAQSLAQIVLQVMQSAAALVMALFIVAALLLVDPLATAAAGLALGLLYLLVAKLARPRLVGNSAILRDAYDRRVQIIQESLGGIRDLILDDSQAASLAEFARIDAALSQARARTAFIASAPRYVVEAGGMVVIAALTIVLLQRPGGIAAGIAVLGALALGALRLLPLLQQLFYSWTSLAGSRSVTDDVLGLLALPLPAPREAIDANRLTVRQAIRFDDVSFSYPGSLRPAVDGASFEIRAGTSLAFAGRTGSGKSTMADLLMGLLEPTSGRILIDGVPLSRDNREAWQREVAHVPQAIFLADTTIARNIAFGRAPETMRHADIAAAARLAQLDAVIAALPEGLDTRIGERGVKLSGGQRQRLGIARAIYKDAPVVIFDEATSALDDETEAAVLGAMRALNALGKTLVTIAHRETTLRACDTIITLEAGRVVSVVNRAGGASR